MSEYRYKELLKESLKGSKINNDAGARKRRKISKQYKSNQQDNTRRETQEVITVSDNDQESEDSVNSSDFEDVSLDDEEESYGVNILSHNTADSNKQESLSIAINPVHEAKKKSKFTSISKNEREIRRNIHQMYLGLMLSHGVIRNRWCNAYNLLMELRKHVSPQIIELLHQNDSDQVLPLIKSRRFLDGLKKLMTMYSSNYRVNSQGLVRKNWNELSIKQSNTEVDVTFSKFFNLVTKFRGSRDIAAQGFVSLLRSVDLNARLIFSLQPPDYTLIAELPKIDDTKTKLATHTVIQSPLLQKFASRDSKRSLLASTRKKSTTLTDEVKHANYFEDSSYPIFWIDVWDKYVKKWVSIDPIVLQTIEVPPMRRKCKFEPPSTDMRNQLTYVIAYDRLGGVKDVTRRYSLYYNAKTVKKKIQFRSEEDEIWYNRILKACCLQIRKSKVNKMDILEAKEFHTRDLAEGVPNNIADFKNHPVYALESQLKQNEIIFPKDESSTCGFFRNKLSKGSQEKEQTVIPIYKRSHVYGLKSAKAWYLQGRVLKVGVQPLKLKKKQMFQKKNATEDYDNEEMTRLYAEFQTKLYIPPPIADGVIPKNEYGNIDIYTPSMLPDNGHLVDTSLRYSMKIAERAAKLMDIDYAKAIVAFDFGKSVKKKSQSRSPTAREGGLLIDIQYKEAMYLIMENLLEEEEDSKRQAVGLNSLNNWKYFLTKLRISERLNKEHGKLNSEDEESMFSDELDDGKFSVHSDNSGSDRTEFGGGGFFVDNSAVDTKPELNWATEKYISTSEEFTGSCNEDPREKEGENEENYNRDEKNVKAGKSEGGFFLEEAEPDLKYSQLKLDDLPSNNEIDHMPDYYFKQDVNGDLRYEPSADDNQLEQKSSYVVCTGLPKKHNDLRREPSSHISHEMPPNHDHKKEGDSNRMISPQISDDIEETDEKMVDKNASSAPSSQKSPSEIYSSQDSFSEEIADEEQVFGFEYSDTD